MKPRELVWREGEKTLPFPLSLSDFILPRPLVWLTVQTTTDTNSECCCVLNGYTAAAYTPPVLYFSASALPRSVLETVKQTKLCTLSAVTAHESGVAIVQEALAKQHNENEEDGPSSFALDNLNLQAAQKRDDYPRAIQSSPIHMYCTLHQVVSFVGSSVGGGDEMILLWVEHFVVDESVLSDPTEDMKARNITGKIDASLVRPLVGIGHHRVASLSQFVSMPRPTQNNDGSWGSTNFDRPVAAPTRTVPHQNMEWNFRTDGRSCALGFNPITALIMPRPIGWISTFSKTKKVPHLAPYSFFMDVNQRMVAFSGYRRHGTDPKDAQKDAQETNCFCFNLVSKDLVLPMNVSAAEIGRHESEFAIANLEWEQANVVDAPVVKDAKVTMECEYVRTVNVGSFSIVVGVVKAIAVCPDMLVNGRVDIDRLQPVTRLGYLDEYGIL